MARSLSSRLRQRITISRKTRTKKPTGGFDVAWAPIATVWAEVIGLGGREATIGEALQGVEMYRITVRFGIDVRDQDQVRYGDIDLNVHPPTDPTGRREALVFMADSASTETVG